MIAKKASAEIKDALDFTFHLPLTTILQPVSFILDQFGTVLTGTRVMLRVTKLADYGILMLAFFATHPQNTCAARDIANAVKLPLPIARKALKLLSKAGLLVSQRGTMGGYGLARPPEQITVASIIRALEGPIALTQCSDTNGDCGLEAGCPVRANWHQINNAIHSALEKITLDQMTQPLPNLLFDSTPR